MNVQALLTRTILLSSLLLVAACATKPIEISASPIDKPTLMVPTVSKINSRDVKWVVVNRDNFNQVMADIEKKNGNVVLFALTDKGYEALSMNVADLRQLVQQQQAIIAAYEKYYNDGASAVPSEQPKENSSWFRWGE